MRLYHGTNTVVTKPEIRIVGFTKDFGYGFYCTEYERQAKRWAVSKRNPHRWQMMKYGIMWKTSLPDA